MAWKFVYEKWNVVTCYLARPPQYMALVTESRTISLERIRNPSSSITLAIAQPWHEQYDMLHPKDRP